MYFFWLAGRILFNGEPGLVNYVASVSFYIIAYKIKVSYRDVKAYCWYCTMAKVYDIVLLVFGVVALIVLATHVYGLL